MIVEVVRGIFRLSKDYSFVSYHSPGNRKKRRSLSTTPLLRNENTSLCVPGAEAPGTFWLCRSAAAVVAAAVVIAATVVVAAAVAIAAAVVVAAATAAVVAAIAATVVAAAVPVAAAAAAEQNNNQNDNPAAARAIIVPHSQIPPVRCEAGSPQSHHMPEAPRGVRSGEEFLLGPGRTQAAPRSELPRPPCAGPGSGLCR